MEIPYAGRAIINDFYNGVEITIPAQRNWFIVIFLSFWLLVWTGAELFVPVTFFVSGFNGPPVIFGLVWMAAWTVGGIFAGSLWWWNIAGKEIVTVSEGVLTIKRKGSLAKTRSYDLTEAKNFRSVEDPQFYFGFGQRAFTNPWKQSTNGTVKFDYGMGTVMFGDRLSQVEGNLIIQTLLDKKLIS